MYISHEQVTLKHEQEVQIPSHRKCPSGESDLFPLLSWNPPADPESLQDKQKFIHYISVKQSNQSENPTQELESDWSHPVRLSANESGSKVTLSMPVCNGEYTTVPLCVTGHDRRGLTYFVIREDSSPFFLLYNHTSVPVVYGHQNTTSAGNLWIDAHCFIASIS